MVVFSELYYPGFEAQLDGKPTPLYLAWESLMAVYVPAGQHQVFIKYNPDVWRTGRTISLIGLIAFALLAFIAWRHDR